MALRSVAWTLAVVLGLALATGVGAAEKKYGPGVSDTEITLGQTMPYTRHGDPRQTHPTNWNGDPRGNARTDHVRFAAQCPGALVPRSSTEVARPG